MLLLVLSNYYWVLYHSNFAHNYTTKNKAYIIDQVTKVNDTNFPCTYTSVTCASSSDVHNIFLSCKCLLEF